MTIIIRLEDNQLVSNKKQEKKNKKQNQNPLRFILLHQLTVEFAHKFTLTSLNQRREIAFFFFVKKT